MEKKLYCATTYQVDFQQGANYTSDDKEQVKAILSANCPSFSASENDSRWTISKTDLDKLVSDIITETVTSDVLDLDELSMFVKDWLSVSDPSNDYVHLAWL